MGTPVISRKPEFVHKQCNHCRVPLEFQSPKSNTPQISVLCYSCQKISKFDLTIDINTSTNGKNSSNSSTSSKKSSRRQFGTGWNNQLLLIFVFI
jgi:hypothetical protein